jgi:hypothetical protein
MTDDTAAADRAKIDYRLDDPRSPLLQARNYAQAFAALTEFDDIDSGEPNAIRARQLAADVLPGLALASIAESLDRISGDTLGRDELLADVVTGMIKQARRRHDAGRLEEIAEMLEYVAARAREESLKVRIHRDVHRRHGDGEASTDG